MPELTNLLQYVPGFDGVLSEHLSSDFAAFARAAWPIVFPGRRKLVWSPAYDLLCETLTAIKQRQPGYQRVIWNMPPRCGKSFFCSIAFPSWMWLGDPSHQFVSASYSMDLSTEHSIARRNLIASAWYQRLFADRFQLASDRNLTTQFSNTQRGTMFATSTGARLMGFGFDTCIADDLTSADMALSESERSAANRWFDHTLRQRANDPATAAIIVICQRTHELDVPGYLMESEPGVWRVIRLPLVAEERERHVFPLSGKVWQREAGDVLQPKRFTAKVVSELRSRRLVFAGQYQQQPAPLEGNLIRRSEVRYYGGIDPTTGQRDERLPERFDLVLLSVDCAFKAEAHNDKVAILAIGVRARRRFILEARNRHLDAAATEEAIRSLRERYGATVVLIEDKANGPAIIERLKQNVPGVIAVNPQGGKVARMYAAAPEWQARDWYLDRNAGCTEEFILQITVFPKGRWDDLCDAMSQAAIWLAQHQHYGAEPLFEIVPRPVPGLPAAPDSHVSPELGKKIVDGVPLSSAEEDALIFGGLLQ